MTILNEGVHAGEFLLAEANGHISRETVTIESGANLVAGTVVGKITASGKYIAYLTGAIDGSEVAFGVLFADVDASAADTAGVIIARDAEVDANALTGNDAAGDIELALVGIIVR